MLTDHAKGDGLGSFIVDRSRELISAEAEVSSGAIEALLPQRPRMRFAVRLGELSSGAWGAWSDSPSESVELSVAPPTCAEGDVLTVSEHLWSLYGADVLPPSAVNAVE